MSWVIERLLLQGIVTDPRQTMKARAVAARAEARVTRGLMSLWASTGLPNRGVMNDVHHRRRIVALLLVAIALIAAAGATYPYLHGLSFVVRVADMRGVVRRAADLDAVRVREFVVSVPLTAERSLSARVFQPTRSRRAVLVVSGLNPAGIDEPRLMALARQLAASNLTVVTPDIRELADFRITAALTDAIERSAVWLASRGDLAPDRRVGMIGISFSGGLSVVAAGRPALAGKVAYVFALGGHHDLPRVLAYLCMGAGTQATRPPHEYAPRSSCWASPIASCRRNRSSRCRSPSAGFCGHHNSPASTPLGRSANSPRSE